MSRKHLLVGNWKMNLGPHQAREFASSLAAEISALKRTDVWVCPPMVSLAAASEALLSSPVLVGAQNVHWAKTGAFTGETSPLFLKDLGVTFSLTGHSERRTYFGETSETVAMRTETALAEGLKVIVCVGETETERANGTTDQVLGDQLAPVFARLSAALAPQVVIAYEPVWAIGTGKVASIQDIAATHKFIQQLWNAQGYDHQPTILYGGSVNPQNFAEILALKEVSGALVGGASIKLDQWLELIRIAEATAE
jgi:triosephosphate isomerase